MPSKVKVRQLGANNTYAAQHASQLDRTEHLYITQRFTQDTKSMFFCARLVHVLGCEVTLRCLTTSLTLYQYLVIV